MKSLKYSSVNQNNPQVYIDLIILLCVCFYMEERRKQ